MDVINNYDALGRPLSKWQGFIQSDAQQQVTTWQQYNLSQTYNLAGGVTSLTYPSGRTVTNSYDAIGRLSSFNGTLGDGVGRSYASGITYTAAGQMARETYGTQTPLYLNLHYNNRLQMVDLRLGDNPTDEWNWTRGALIFYYGTQARNQWNPFANSADNNGNVLRQVNYAPLSAGGYVIPQMDDYIYDQLNRVTAVSEWQMNASGQWTADVYWQRYLYDRWGNRTIDVNGTTNGMPGVTRKNFTINTTNNRLTAIDGAGVSYDAAGNQTFDGSYNRWFEGENRISKANGSNGANYYYYDAGGRRVRRVVGGVETWQVYGLGGELVAEYSVSGTFTGTNVPAASAPSKEYAYRSGKLLVVYVSSQNGDGRFKWLVQDHLGSTRMEANLSGSLATLKRHDFLPFGEELLATTGAQRNNIGYEPPASNVKQKFGGYERDDETGLDYAEARFFSSIQGRFTSPDPLMSSGTITEPQGWNGYAYAGNRPTVVTDPSGQLWILYNGNLYWSDLSRKDFEKKYANLKGWKIVDGQHFYASASVSGFKKGGIYHLTPNGSAQFIGMVPKTPEAVRERIDVGGQILGVYLQTVEIGVAIGTGGASQAALVTLRYVIKQTAKEVVEEIVQEVVVNTYVSLILT